MTKRTFLKTVGTGVPTLRLVMEGAAAQTAAGAASTPATAKFTPVDCAAHFTASPADFAPWQPSGGRAIRTPAGARQFRGIPFAFAPEGGKTWFLVSRRQGHARTVEVPLSGNGTFLVLAQFCDQDPNENAPADIDAFEKVGQHLADAVLTYEDGSTQTWPVRRRFEVNSLSTPWGHQCFAAVPHRDHAPVQLNQPLRTAFHWGDLQTGVWDGGYEPSDDGVSGSLWLCALENPAPDRALKSLRWEARSDDALAVCAVTVCHGAAHPLRRERLSLYRIGLPEGQAGDKWQASVDLGVVVRSFTLPGFQPESWLAAPVVPGVPQPPARTNYLYVEAAATRDATITLRNAGTGASFEFDLRRLEPDKELEARPASARMQVLEREKVWLRGKVVDASTGRPTPVRLAFRSKEGRYIPPYGHRREVNSAWLSDYGADVQMGGVSFAYVDGNFQVELPVGEVYVEILKGFEYEPIRRKLEIRAGQSELDFRLERFADLRSKGWVSADTHVHFLSPTTAVLEAQAEGLNLINLLAAQWGDLFTNVGDRAHTPVASPDGEAMVWVGTENRQHLLGHIALLGGHGGPHEPLSAGGPGESYFGDPVWSTLAEWADACRAREGLAVAVHFPYPTAELAADVVLGKIDAVELWPTSMSESFNTLRFLDWYRYLNCGYRLPAVSGTDKMGAWIAAGAYRGYAQLGQDPFNFPNWAKAVRRGNTFMSSGPLLFLQVDGRAPGEEIRIGPGGGKVEVRAEVSSTVPVHRVEIVVNGRVAASREEKDGARQALLRDSVAVTGPSWIAARCASRFSVGGARVAAHTSPVYMVTPGREQFSAPAAAYMLRLIEGSETWVRNLATRADAERHARVVAVIEEARKRLEQRVRDHRG